MGTDEAGEAVAAEMVDAFLATALDDGEAETLARLAP